MIFDDFLLFIRYSFLSKPSGLIAAGLTAWIPLLKTRAHRDCRGVGQHFKERERLSGHRVPQRAGFYYGTGSTSTLQIEKIEFLAAPILRQLAECKKENIWSYIVSLRTIQALENLIEKKEHPL